MVATCVLASSTTRSEPFFTRNSSNTRAFTSGGVPCLREGGYFVYLTPFLSGFVRESFVQHLHNLIELLTNTINPGTHRKEEGKVLIMRPICDFLH